MGQSRMLEELKNEEETTQEMMEIEDSSFFRLNNLRQH